MRFMNFEWVLVGVFALVNVISLLTIAYDKHQARSRKSAERISEVILFFMATAFGSLGVYIGMLIFRHKTQKWYFQVGIPLLIAQNIAALYLLRELLLLN